MEVGAALQERNSRKVRDALIDKYRGFVKQVAGALVTRFNLPRPMFEELEAAGYLGLIEAAERYKVGSGKKFEAYAYLRVRGAMIDSLRQTSDLPGELYRYLRFVRAVHQERMNSASSEDELIAGLKDHQVTGHKLAKILDFVAKGGLMYRLAIGDASSEVTTIQDSRETPEDSIKREQFWQRIVNLVDELPQKERMIVREYYFLGRSFQEIIERNEGMSKSWVSRLHSRAIATIKNRFFEMQSLRGSAV